MAGGRKFTVVPGGRSRGPGEAQRLDQFLQADPGLLASLREAERRRTLLHRSLLCLLILLGGSVFAWATLRSPIPTLRTAVARVPTAAVREQAQQLTDQAVRAIGASRLDEARRLVELSLALDDRQPEAWHALGRILKVTDPDAAKKAFKRCLKLDPTHDEARAWLADLYMEAGRFALAEEILRPAAGAAFIRAKLYLLTERFEEASRQLARARADTPDDERLRQLAEAAAARRLDDHVRLLLASPDDTINRGWSLFEKGDHRGAITVFRGAVARNPIDANALRGLGWSLLKERRTPEARKVFKDLLAVSPEDPSGLNGIAHCLRREGQGRRAIEYWKRLQKAMPQSLGAAQGMAWTYFEMGDYRQAAVYLAELNKAYPGDRKVAEALEISIRKMS